MTDRGRRHPQRPMENQPGEAAFVSTLPYTSLHGAALGDPEGCAVRFRTFTCRDRRTAKAQLPPVPFSGENDAA